MSIFDAALAVAGKLATLSALAKETKENIEEDWYQASKDMEEFLALEEKLRRKSEDWREALRSAGMSDDIRITEPLNDAIQSLKREKTKMDKVQSNSCCVYRFNLLFIFRGHPFPSHVKENMQKLVDAFDNIPNTYADRNEPARIVEHIADTRLEPYQITVDPRIVKLAGTQDKVMERLEDEAGNQVVTLFGPPGTGKTCLAQSVAQHYEARKGGAVFADGARFLSCGPSATVESICKKLYQTFGISDVNTDSAPDAKAEHEAFKSKTTGASEGQASNMPLVKKLPRRLKERRLLIILDDVSDPTLLKDNLIVPHARNVKYLITTQQKDIWGGAELIHMELPDLKTAMTILGKYIPNLISTNGVIPSQFEDQALLIVQKAQSHPMTLAIIGMQIDDHESWDLAVKNFDDLLSKQDVLTLSMRLAVDALASKPDAQKLLYLVAMCKPPYVPEVVLQLLFQHMGPESGDSNHSFAFEMNGKTLKERDLIAVKEKNWTLSSTYQHFILKNKQEDVSQVLQTLLTKDNNDEDHELVKTLCVLYIECKKNVPFTTLAVDALEDAAKEFYISMKDQDMILSMREAIEPLIYLLFPSKEGEEYDTRRHRLVSKAIKCFLSKQDLDDVSFAQLLSEEDIYEKICEVLMKMTQVQDNDSPILTEDKTMIMEELRFSLTLSSPDTVTTTLETISVLAHAANCDFILADDRILMNMLKILRTSRSTNEILSTLTCLTPLAQSSTAREKIASCEGLVEAIVAIFHVESDITYPNNMVMKVFSIQALGSIALHKMTSTKLVKTSNLLDRIAQFLGNIYDSENEEFLLNMAHYGAKPTIQCMLSLLKGNDGNKDDITKHRDLMGVVTKIFHKYNGDTAYYGNNPYSGDEVAQVALQVLTIIAPEEYISVPLFSIDAYTARGHSNAYCGRYLEAFDDYKMADRMDKENDLFYKTKLCFFKTMVKDYKGALAYARFALDANPNDQFLLQEIGVVKEKMGDFKGAKVDFDKSLASSPDDYEVLKHRAYVNFMLSCTEEHEDAKRSYLEEAHKDAKRALQVIPKYRVDKRDTGQAGCLGVLSVPKFLEYDLK